tara:strand:- start:937 stop:1338 length:402 start_codon:yes stop_codon:yes gene_type:complete
MTVPASAKPFYDSFVEAVDGYFWRIVLRPEVLDEVIGLGYRYKHIPDNSLQNHCCGCGEFSLYLKSQVPGIYPTFEVFVDHDAPKKWFTFDDPEKEDFYDLPAEGIHYKQLDLLQAVQLLGFEVSWLKRTCIL